MSPLPILKNPQSSSERRHLPTVAALSALWEEVASKPLWAPPHFWRYLRLRSRMRLSLLEPDAVHLLVHPGQVNDCGSCTDICCVGPRSTVLLRLVDIATLKDLGRTQLISQDKPEFTSVELQQRPALLRNVQSQSWRRFPVLKQNSFGACMALGLDGKCTLFPHWPLSCARFPYALHLDDLEIFYSRRCQSFWIHPGATQHSQEMKLAAVASYNERIKDAILLEYAPTKLRELGLLDFLRD